MAWTEPHFSSEEVDDAARLFLDPPVLFDADDNLIPDAWSHTENAYRIINNWRASHNFPMNTFQSTLRNKARPLDGQALVAQRIKRLPSILSKLKRYPDIPLSDMQDIGGCRAVLRNVSQVRKLRDQYLISDLKHELERCDDYIEYPKYSGYRSAHLIYRYYSDRKNTFNGLKIELQLRTQLQHAWATAVETVDRFTHQALKASSGNRQWRRFFTLMGTVIALREGTAPVPNTPTEPGELSASLRKRAESLDVIGRLQAYGMTIRHIEQPQGNAYFYLVRLDPRSGVVKVTGYPFRQRAQAERDYLELERSLSPTTGEDAVMVSVDSMQSLYRAYPNYFLDTHLFIEIVRAALGESL